MKKILTLLSSLLLLISTTALKAQIERPKWELGGGIRFNYMGLGGGFSGTRNSDGYSFDVKYKEIGMDNYSPSFAIAIGGRYKKWNLDFGGSRGTYGGSFTTMMDMVRDTLEIDSGSVVDGTVDMTMLALATNFALIQRKHDLGIGIGILVLYMGSDYSTYDIKGQKIKLGSDQWFPMPFLSVMGRLNFGNFKIVASGGGAYFQGKMSEYDYKVTYLTADINGSYDFLHTSRIILSADLGYRFLYMKLESENDIGLYQEKDFYNGPYLTAKIRFFSKAMWKYVKKKDRKKEGETPLEKSK